MPTPQSSNPSPLIPGYLTTAEAAERSGLDPQTIAHYLLPKTRDGIEYPPKLRGVKLASIWLVEEKSLDEYLKSKPTPGPKRGSHLRRTRRTKRQS